jgi:penicillin-binding protein 1C
MDYLHQQAPGRPPAAPAGLVQRQTRFQPALEPERSEWFLQGTETAVVALASGQGRAPRIMYPADTSILAIDPDIPASRQRVIFEAQAAQGLQWQLDGEVLGSAERTFSWQPRPGKHELVLTDGRAILARASFQVRGGAQ